MSGKLHLSGAAPRGDADKGGHIRRLAVTIHWCERTIPQNDMRSGDRLHLLPFPCPPTGIAQKYRMSVGVDGAEASQKADGIGDRQRYPQVMGGTIWQGELLAGR